MSPEEILTFFQELVDDAPDDESAYILMDTAYTKRNESRVWSMLMKLDTSITHSPGNTWLTQKTLPTDFASVAKLFGGNADNEYTGVPFVELAREQNNGNQYALDIAGSNLRLTGSPSSALTMYLFYQYAPTSLIGLSDAQKAASTTIVWPKRFCPILAYDMAEIFFGGWDADEVTRQMAPYQRAAYKALDAAMVKWNSRNILKMMGGAAGFARGSGLGSSSRADMPDGLN